MLNDKIGTVNILFKDIFTVYCYPCINATSHDAMKMCANRTQILQVTVVEAAIRRTTLPETNIAPENGPSQKETSLSTTHFQVLC